MPPTSRFTVPVQPFAVTPPAAGETFGAIITSTQPIVVERALYFDLGRRAMGGRDERYRNAAAVGRLSPSLPLPPSPKEGALCVCLCLRPHFPGQKDHCARSVSASQRGEALPQIEDAWRGC